MRHWFALLAVLAMLAASCSGSGGDTTTTGVPATTTPTVTPPSTASAPTTLPPPTVPPATVASTTTVPQDEGHGTGLSPRAVAAFASFPGVPMLQDEPSYAGPATPASIAGIYVPPSVAFDLDGRVVDLLESQGFAVVPSTSRLFYPVYQETVYEGEVHFVTVDAAYHYLHLAFSKILRDLEQEELLPILESLLTGLVDTSRAQRDELAGTPLQDAADRVVQLYEASAALAGLDVGPIGPLAQREVDLAMAAAEFTRSPITGLGPVGLAPTGKVDYSLFQPRGHYLRNAELERYFRAMSVLGNENFDVNRGDTMLLAALASRVLLADPALLQAWELIYEPTAFLVGMADDYTPQETAARIDELAPGWRADPTLLDESVGAAAGQALLRLRPVGIDPEAASVRIMGVRFVVDSYVYDQLRYPSVGDPPFGRVYGSALDLVAAFGSGLAYRIMDESGLLTDPDTGERWSNYDQQLASLSGMIADRVPDDWAATVYDAWLYALEPVWQPLGAVYPDFMRTPAWEVKNLQSGLGSYTELKHDTILYAKQSIAVEGDFEPVEYPEPRHWVEPHPVAFERMAAVLGLLEDGLTERALLPPESGNAGLIAALDGFLGRLARLAADELAGRPISAADNDWLGQIGSTMEALWIRSSDEPDAATGEFPGEDMNAALVADIMRSSFQFLEIGTGYVDTLYVLVPDDAGRFQIAKGGVYSYYEFWRDEEEGRLTDQEWWELLATEPPARPGWQAPLFSGPAYAVGLAAGMDCSAFAGAAYQDVVAYWLAYGMPSLLDWDENGIPCDEDGQVLADPAFFAGLPSPAGLFCRDLQPDGYSFAQAVAYWLREGAPDRMDADQNGIPCETVYPGQEIEAFFTVGG